MVCKGQFFMSSIYVIQMEQERIQANLSEKLDATEQLEPDSTNAEKLEKEGDDKDEKKKGGSGSDSDDPDDKKKVYLFN